MKTKRRIRLLVVDDHEVVRDGLVEFLANGEIEVVATAGDALQAISLIGTVRPDAVLLDVRLGEFDGLWALEKIRASQPSLPVLLFSSYDNPTYIARAIALGACDYLLKHTNRVDVLEAIRRSVDGESIAFSSEHDRVRRIMAVVKKLPDCVSEFGLTQREVQVLRHVGLGLSNKEIAKSLKISVETVKEHVQNILRKTKATDRTDVAVKAVRWGLID